MKRPKAWVILTGAVLALSLCSCATWNVARTEIGPGLKSLVIAAGPDLGKAIVSDLCTLIGWPIDQGESIVGYHGPSDTVPPPAK